MVSLRKQSLRGDSIGTAEVIDKLGRESVRRFDEDEKGTRKVSTPETVDLIFLFGEPIYMYGEHRFADNCG